MRRFIHEHNRWFALLVAVLGTLSGIGFSIFANLLTADAVGSIAAIVLWGLVGTMFLATSLVLSFLCTPAVIEKKATQERLERILEVLVRGLVLPKKLENYQIRADVRLYNPMTKKLDYFAHWSYPIAHDKKLSICCDGVDKDKLVIVKALTARTLVSEDLPPDHVQWYTGEHKGRIWPELVSVVAVPIVDPFSAMAVPIGTLSIDSNKKREALGLDTVEGDKLVELLAMLVYNVLREAPVSSWLEGTT